jgi:hypothetical protein
MNEPNLETDQLIDEITGLLNKVGIHMASYKGISALEWMSRLRVCLEALANIHGSDNDSKTHKPFTASPTEAAGYGGTGISLSTHEAANALLDYYVDKPIREAKAREEAVNAEMLELAKERGAAISSARRAS